NKRTGEFCCPEQGFHSSLQMTGSRLASQEHLRCLLRLSKELSEMANVKERAHVDSSVKIIRRSASNERFLGRQ
ncbi:hypothetical protein NDU88_004088, partial [Pleurodeles waltl]